MIIAIAQSSGEQKTNLSHMTMQALSNKTLQSSDSVIRHMTRVSNRYGVINLSQGFLDFDPPREITDRLAEKTQLLQLVYSILTNIQLVKLKII